MYLLIGADLVPTKSNQPLFISGDVTALLGSELQAILNAAQYRIFNLEVPLTDMQTPIKKCGPSLIAPTPTINGITAMGVDLLGLANNHILDQDVQGLMSTQKILDDAGICYLGAGNTVEEASKPHIFYFGQHLVGVYACAEHEFSIATEDSPGANPFDPLEAPDHVKALKDQCDYVIVLYHGGIEHYRYPSPGLQNICRKMVDKGADLVVCQHSHCVGCEEKYLHGHIVYGQGNFLFDDSDSEYWQTGLLIRLEEDLSISYIPLVKKGETVRLADKAFGEQILNEFINRSERIKDNNALRLEYHQLAASMRQEYLLKFMGHSGFWMRAFSKLFGGRIQSWLTEKKYPQKNRLSIENRIECEAHRELLIHILKQ